MNHDLNVVNCHKAIKNNCRSKHYTDLTKEGYSNQLAGRAHKSLQRQLVSVDTRPLGLSDSSGLHVTSSCTTSSVNYPTTNAVLLRPAAADIIRGGVHAGKASNSTCATQPGEFHFTNICGSGGLLPEGTKQICSGEYFKMEGFHMVKDLVENKDWMAKIDLKDAYFLVPIRPAHQTFLQFQWMGITYQLCFLPFSLSYAPRTFTKLMKPVVAFLRERGIKTSTT